MFPEHVNYFDDKATMSRLSQLEVATGTEPFLFLFFYFFESNFRSNLSKRKLKHLQGQQLGKLGLVGNQEMGMDGWMDGWQPELSPNWSFELKKTN